MTEVNSSDKPTNRVKEALAAIKAPPLIMDLPTKFNEHVRKEFPFAACWLWVSEPKVGKSTLIEHMSRAYEKLGLRPLLHLDLENGAGEISGCVKRVGSLDELDRIIALLQAGAISEYGGIALDTADALERWCQELTCAELNIGSMGQHGHGAEWFRSTSHVVRRVAKLRQFEALGKCLVLTSHAKTDENEAGGKTLKPSLTSGTSRDVCGTADSIGYLYRLRLTTKDKQRNITDSYERYLSFSGHKGVAAGSRFKALRNREFKLAHLEVEPEANLFSPLLDAFQLTNGEQNNGKG